MAEALSSPAFSPVRMSAATQESAVAQALQLVGAGRDEVEIEVIEKTDKRVTVRVSPRRSQSESQSTADVPQSTAESLQIPADAVEPISSASESDTAESFDDFATIEDQSVDVTTVEAVAPLAQDIEVAEDEEANEANQVTSPPRVIDEASREKARAAAQTFLDRMGLEARAVASPGPFSDLEAEDENAASRLYLKIEGADVGILIGKHGQTLQSFQYLLNLTLNNRGADDIAPDDVFRVVIDAGGYRSRRAQVLEQSAQQAASRAKRDNRSVRMEPMPAHERRLVHMALRDDDSVNTSSEGREPMRHVVVSPPGVRPAPLNERGSYGNRGGNGRGGGRGFSGNRGGYGNRGGFERD